MTAFSEKKIERLIKLSIGNARLPDTFIPWEEDATQEDSFLPEHLVSLYGHPLYDQLSTDQKRELGRHEVVQVMYSYAWSENLACLFFTRHLLQLDLTSVEYRFLLRELIEEYQHQEMFSKVIIKMDGQPLRQTWLHRVVANFTASYFPADFIFMSVLAVEMIADTYGKIIRRDKSVYNVLRKVSELHNIEEGRHIHYTKMWLDRFTKKAGLFKRTMYSLVIMLNIFFMRSLYVRHEIFENIGVENPKQYLKAAQKNYKQNFADTCLDEAIEFTEEIGGFNPFTRFMWRRVLSAKV